MATRHPLPYGFAKAHTLLLEDDGHTRVLWATEAASPTALGEVLRQHAVARIERAPAAELAWKRTIAFFREYL